MSNVALQGDPCADVVASPDAPATLPRLLTAEQVARQLSISSRQVKRYAHSGQLPHVRLGKLYRFRPEDVAAFIKGRLSTTSSAPRVVNLVQPADAQPQQPTPAPQSEPSAMQPAFRI